MAALRTSGSAQRTTTLWSLVVLLFTIAFWRTMAPDRSTAAFQKALLSYEQNIANQSELEELRELWENIQREKLALIELRKKQTSNAKSGDLTKLNGDLEHEQKKTQFSNIGNETDSNAQRESSTADKVKMTQDSNFSANTPQGDFEFSTAAQLSEGDCSVVLSPISAKAGLGTQVAHIWNYLTIANAVPGACVALPPVVAQQTASAPKYIPFHEVFDVYQLTDAGMKFIPLNACHQYGVPTVFDDAYSGETSLKSYMTYVADTHPVLAQETTLVTGDTKALKFLQPTGSAANFESQIEHIMQGKPVGTERYCVGLGRMVAEYEPNEEILKSFAPALTIQDYVTNRFPQASELMFVKLRWNLAQCDAAKGQKNIVCIYGDSLIPAEDYVMAIATLAEQIGAKQIYLSTPSHLPIDVLAYLSTALETVEPVILDLGGDEFKANIVERELAARALSFVSDGGVWGSTIQLSRKHRNSERYDPNINSYEMIKRWKDDGSPKTSVFMRTSENKQSPETNEQSQDPSNSLHEQSQTTNEATQQDGEAAATQQVSAQHEALKEIQSDSPGTRDLAAQYIQLADAESNIEPSESNTHQLREEQTGKALDQSHESTNISQHSSDNVSQETAHAEDQGTSTNDEQNIVHSVEQQNVAPGHSNAVTDGDQPTPLTMGQDPISMRA